MARPRRVPPENEAAAREGKIKQESRLQSRRRDDSRNRRRPRETMRRAERARQQTYSTELVRRGELDRDHIQQSSDTQRSLADDGERPRRHEAPRDNW